MEYLVIKLLNQLKMTIFGIKKMIKVKKKMIMKLKCNHLFFVNTYGFSSLVGRVKFIEEYSPAKILNIALLIVSSKTVFRLAGK